MHALILGGTGDIGGAIARQFRAEGLLVRAVGRSDFNLASGESIAEFFDREDARFEVLVHSGGLNHPKRFENLSDSEIRETMEVNLFGFLQVVRHCMGHWRQCGYGRVLVISSLYGFLAREGRLPYTVAKHALNGAVKTLAIELAQYGVLVNSLSPGYIETKMTRQNNSPETIARLMAGIPVRRLGTPEDIAVVSWFLCSPKNRYINGQDIVVDGGFSIGGFQS